MHSIAWKIAGLMFLSIVATVFLLVYLANVQMTVHLQEYLQSQHFPDALRTMGNAAASPEEILLTNIHHSLYGVGALLLIPGLLASYLLARSITVPLRKLANAADDISRGQYGRGVSVKSRSEVGRLAEAFNSMSRSLAGHQKNRRQFLAAVVHELRTPLAIIRGNLEGMVDGMVEKSEENLHSLCEEADHLNRLITDLRDLSLAETGQLTLEKERVDISELISRAANMLEPLFLEKGLLLHLQTAPDIPPLPADARRLNQILYNLLTNAIRHTPPQGTVSVITRISNATDRAWLQIRVSDTGSGITAVDLPHIFEHFYRADPSRDKRSGGSGIGLAIVKQLTELHSGRVEVASTPGQGTHFTLYLPFNGHNH
ncbi:MAG TPA: ATP-binding protein [Patescibacteria group bacterium]|nr:ATP-binding protein [Patescibacteria group bacterium]